MQFRELGYQGTFPRLDSRSKALSRQMSSRLQVVGADILGQYELRVGIQFLKQSRYLLRIQSCWNT